MKESSNYLYTVRIIISRVKFTIMLELFANITPRFPLPPKMMK